MSPGKPCDNNCRRKKPTCWKTIHATTQNAKCQCCGFGVDSPNKSKQMYESRSRYFKIRRMTHCFVDKAEVEMQNRQQEVMRSIEDDFANNTARFDRHG